MSANRDSSGEAGDLDFDVLDGLLSFHLRAVTLALSRDLDARLAGLPVARGTGKVSCLLLIDANPGIRPSTIARATLRDPATATRLIDGLAAEGLVERTVAPQERRATDLTLTEKGRRLAATVRDVVANQSESFFHDLTAQERDLLLGLLRRTYRRIAGFGEGDGTKSREEGR